MDINLWVWIYTSRYGYIPLGMDKGVRYFSKCIFPMATSQMTISQAATSQIFNFPKDRLGRGQSAAARTDLGSCRLRNCTFGKLPLGKIPMGSCHLGEIQWEST